MRITLPETNLTRWTIKAKLAICEAIDLGQLSRVEALSRYSLSADELDSWIAKATRHGMPGLRVTRIKQYR
jgi:hypothetical protein